MAGPTRYAERGLDLLDPSANVAEPGDPRHLALIRRFLADSVERCSYWRRRFERRGVRLDTLTTFQSLSAVPALSPREAAVLPEGALMPDAWTAAVREGRPAHHYVPVARRFSTSGSTATRKVSYYSVDDWEANCAATARAHAHVPFEDRNRLFNGFDAGHFAGKNNEESFLRMGALVESRRFTSRSPQDVLEQLYRGARHLGGFNALALPTCSAGVSKGTSLDTLLDLDVDNYIGRNVRMVTVGGAAAPAHLRLRERLAEADALAGAAPTHYVDKYGCSEVGIIAVACTQGRLHLQQGLVFTEVIDQDTGVHVESGDRGVIALTSLRQGSRFIRYLVGDEATYRSERCDCGRATPRLTNIARVTDLERLESGCASGGV